MREMAALAHRNPPITLTSSTSRSALASIASTRDIGPVMPVL